MEKGEAIEGKVDWKGRPANKGKHGGAYVALFILATNAFENMANFATSLNLVTYFNGVMHYDIADAADLVTNYSGTSFILSIALAFVADSFVERYKVAIAAGCIEFLGFVMLTIQAHYPSLKPHPCNIFDPLARCEKPDGSQSALLFSSLYLTAVGSAGMKACLTSHCADQFEEKDPREAKQMSSFFNWLLLSLSMGAVVSLLLIVWLQINKGWDMGFGASTLSMLVGVITFVIGVPRYRNRVLQSTNPITEFVQVFVASFRNRNLPMLENVDELYELEREEAFATQVEFLPHTDIFRFLDKAAIPPIPQSPKHSLPIPWKLCSVTQVENAKTVLGMLPIFLCTIMMSTCLAQLQTFTIQQGLTMDTHITHHAHIPPASLPIISFTFMAILIPIYDRLVVPSSRRFTGHPTGITHLQRIGVGLVFSMLSMVAAALVEVKRKSVARKEGMLEALPILQPLPMSVFWLTVQYCMFGMADMFTYVGLVEFFYCEAPKAMKSIATSFLWCSMALGFFLSAVLVQVVNHLTKGLTRSGGWLAGNNLNRNHLNLFYWLLSLVSLVNFFNYLVWARWYKYRSKHG